MEPGDVGGERPDFEVSGLIDTKLLAARVPRAPLRQEDRGRRRFRAGIGREHHVGLLHRQVRPPRDVGIPDLGAVPVPVVAGLRFEQEVPGLLRGRARAVEDVSQGADRGLVFGGKHPVFGGREHRPAVLVGAPPGGVPRTEPLLELRIPVVGPRPRARLHVDHIAGRHGKAVEVVLDRGHVVVGIGCGPVHHVLEVAVVVGIGAAAEVVAVVVQDDEQRPIRVGVVLFVLVHHLLVLQGSVAAAAVLVALVAGARHGHDLLGCAGVWIDVLNMVRAVAEGGAYLAWRPEVVELHPGPAAGRRVGVDRVGPVGGVKVRRVGVGIVLGGAVEVDVVDDRPVEALGDERRDHPLAEGGLGGKVALSVGHARAEGILRGELVELDLHPQVAGVEERPEGVVLREADHVEPRVALGRLHAAGGAVRLLPVGPL